MYKIFLLAVTIGSFIFAGSWDTTPKSTVTSDQNKQYYFAENTSNDDLKVEAGRRRGKGQRGRRRGGGGLR